MFIRAQGEVVKLLADDPVRNDYGAVVGWMVTKEIPDCVVSPAGDQVVSGDGFIRGDLTKLQVLAPAGTEVREGQHVQIRGEVYQVEHVPFDYSYGRRPLMSLHRPRVIFTVARGQAHDHA